MFRRSPGADIARTHWRRALTRAYRDVDNACVKRRSVAVLAASFLAVPAVAATAATHSPVASSAPLPGTWCGLLPADNVWHSDVSGLPVHPRSEAWLAHMSAATTRLHPDFGPTFGAAPVPYGIR